MHTPNFSNLLSPHRATPSSHYSQTGSPHRLSNASITGGNSSPPQGIPTPIPPLPNVGIELSEVQPGMIKILLFFFLNPLSFFIIISYFIRIPELPENILVPRNLDA